MEYGIRCLLEIQLRLPAVLCGISTPKPGPAGGKLSVALLRFPIYPHHIHWSLKLALESHRGAALTSVLFLMLSLVGFAV